MADKIHLTVVTTEETLLDCMVSYVNIPTGFGSVGVLKDHAPMLCAVGEGKLKYRCEDESGGVVALSSGVADVHNNEVTILVKTAKLL